MLPVTAVNSVVDVRLVEIVYVSVVDVDVDVAVAPSASPSPTSAPCRSERETSAEGQAHPWDIPGIVIRIVGIGRRTVDDYWVIGRDVNDLGVCLRNYDHLLAFGGLGFYLLLRVGF